MSSTRMDARGLADFCCLPFDRGTSLRPAATQARGGSPAPDDLFRLLTEAAHQRRSGVRGCWEGMGLQGEGLVDTADVRAFSRSEQTGAVFQSRPFGLLGLAFSGDTVVQEGGPEIDGSGLVASARGGPDRSDILPVLPCLSCICRSTCDTRESAEKRLRQRFGLGGGSLGERGCGLLVTTRGIDGRQGGLGGGAQGCTSQTEIWGMGGGGGRKGRRWGGGGRGKRERMGEGGEEGEEEGGGGG